MSLYLFLMVIVSLGCGTLPPQAIDPWPPILASGMLVTAWGLLSHVGVRLIAGQAVSGRLEPMLAVTYLEKQLAAFRWLGLGVVALCLAGFGMGRVLESIPVLGQSLSLRSFVLLMPGCLIIAQTVSAEHHYGVLVGYTRGGLGNHLRVVAAAMRTGVAMLIAPVLAIMFVLDVIAVAGLGETLTAWVTVAVVLIAVPLGMPLVMRRLLGSLPLSGRDASWICQLLEGAGVGGVRAARWDTGGRTFNAMVAGFLPGGRTLLLSDRVLDSLPADQLAMVVLHEAAHLKRRHMPLRMATVLPAWIAGVLVSRIAGGSDYAATLGTAAGILFTVLLLRIVSYRTEHDADREACRIAQRLGGRVANVPTTYDAAAESLIAALQAVTRDHPESRRPTWLHPGLADRVAFLRQTAMPANRHTNAGTIAKPA